MNESDYNSDVEGTYDAEIAGTRVEYGEWLMVDRRDLVELLEEPGDVRLYIPVISKGNLGFRVVKSDFKEQIEEWGDYPEYLARVEESGELGVRIMRAHD